MPENYYDALGISYQNWRKNADNPTEFIKYMLSIILFCYRDFENRTKFVRENKVAKSYDIVKNTLLIKSGCLQREKY